MDSYWEMQFAPHILTRGKHYFEEGNVCRIYQFGNTVRATVKGTEDYNVYKQDIAIKARADNKAL